MHRDRVDRQSLAGMERGLSVKTFVAGLHARGLGPDEAADVVSQAFGVHRGAARLYVRSHPAWAAGEGQRGGDDRHGE
jgi:hypothetical protein